MKKLFAIITLGIMLLVPSVSFARHIDLAGGISEGKQFCTTGEAQVDLGNLWNKAYEETSDPNIAQIIVNQEFENYVMVGICIDLLEPIQLTIKEYFAEGLIMTTYGPRHYEIWSLIRPDVTDGEKGVLFGLFFL